MTIRLILSWSICGPSAGIRGGLIGEAGWSRHTAVAGGGGAHCYTQTGRSSRREVSLSGVGSGSSALATCDTSMW